MDNCTEVDSLKSALFIPIIDEIGTFYGVIQLINKLNEKPIVENDI